MASSRTPGRGRVLGAARTTSSPASQIPFSPHAPSSVVPSIRVDGVESPSESSTSLASHGSTPKTSIEDDDISSAVALGASGTIAAASASPRLVCPICMEEMVTLLQLNRHIDDVHRNLEVVQQDEVKNWFKTQMIKAKRFQPLAVINQKLKGLDSFESNEDIRTPTQQIVEVQHIPEPSPRSLSLDDAVTREHWQRHSHNNACSDPMCDKRLGATNGNINCRKCGKLFCEEHTMYQIKLSRSAHHEPVRGSWCRVCETCYKSREGYNDHNGAQRDHMGPFASIRRKAVDASYLEVTRLEKRIAKLDQLLSSSTLQEEPSLVGYFKSLSGATNSKRLLEQSVVQWEEDSTVQQCPFCHQDFNNYTFRRHHCRVCGRIVCADPETQCSTELSLNSTTGFVPQSDKDSTQSHAKIRICKDCHYIVYRRSEFIRATALETPDHRAFQNLKQFERGICTMLPRFQKLIMALQDPDKPPTSVQLSAATKVRRRLTDSFTQYSVAATRIRDLPATSATQSHLQQNVYYRASNFLHVHMLPLKSLPKMLKHASPSPAVSSTMDGHLTLLNNEQSRGRLATIRSSNGSLSLDDSSSAVSSIETEEKDLREKLIVLEEQKFMVGEMLMDAQRRRKFEEVESLGRNLEDIATEINTVQGQLGSLDFESAYIGANLLTNRTAASV